MLSYLFVLMIDAINYQLGNVPDGVRVTYMALIRVLAWFLHVGVFEDGTLFIP